MAMAEACDICVGKGIWAVKRKSSANYVQENKNFGLLAAACAGHKKMCGNFDEGRG